MRSCSLGQVSNKLQWFLRASFLGSTKGKVSYSVDRTSLERGRDDPAIYTLRWYVKVSLKFIVRSTRFYNILNDFAAMKLKLTLIILPLKILTYGGGTHPWNRAGGNTEPATDDGLIEVVGLTTYQLAGGHGTCITQCKSARIVTTKTIPMQVDGEACKLTPSIISLSLLNKVPMLAKCKGSKPDLPQTALEQMTVSVDKISMSDYEQHHYEKDLLKEAACTAERFFRVDRAQEHLHFVMDIATDHLYVLDAEIGTLPQTPEDETAVCSPSGSLENAPDNFMLKGLHTQGYSLLSIDASGQTALHYGSRLGHKDIVKYLIACAPSSILNIADNDKGQTALHKAAAHKRRSICCMLVAGGASLSIADHQGNTPRHLALQAEDTELAAYLHSQEHFQLVADDLETVV
uniref:Diacylglycerol kinase accessory domain-containing protein n=1 Tax=Timema monikensis TaxID=170555 RepID=A0A7R9HKS1_9NEOP|nr:unnamed protein product [Timema monikensis]